MDDVMIARALHVLAAIHWVSPRTGASLGPAVGRGGDRFSIFGCLLALALICTASAGHAASPESSPQWLAYCTKLYGLWNRYGHHPTFHHTGQRARAELALYRCENGDYPASLDTLGVILARNRLAIPPAPGIPPLPQTALEPR